jgi:hypothetical protein
MAPSKNSESAIFVFEGVTDGGERRGGTKSASSGVARKKKKRKFGDVLTQH